MKTTKRTNSEEIGNSEQRERTDINPISHAYDVDKNIEVIHECSQQHNFGQNLSSTTSLQEESFSSAVQSNLSQSGTKTILGTKLGENVAAESHKIDPLWEMLKLLEQNPDKANQDVSKYAHLTVFDFAGQYAFYTTHPMFLTQRAIYLLVSDASGEVSDLVEDKCYFDIEGIMQCQIDDSEQDYKLQCLVNVLNENYQTSDMVANSEEIANSKQRERTDSNPMCHVDDADKNIKVIHECSQQHNFGQNLSSTASLQEESFSSAVQGNLTQSGAKTILGSNLEKILPLKVTR